MSTHSNDSLRSLLKCSKCDTPAVVSLRFCVKKNVSHDRRNGRFCEPCATKLVKDNRCLMDISDLDGTFSKCH